MGITWGVWTGPAAQRWATVFCAAFGLALAAAGMAALYGFWFFPYQNVSLMLRVD